MITFVTKFHWMLQHQQANVLIFGPNIKLEKLLGHK